MLRDKIELKPNEEIIKVVRKHWFIILTELVGTLALILVPAFILLIITAAPEIVSLTLNINLSEYILIIIFSSLIWIILVLLLAFTIWTNYFLDLWVITDQRIITIDQIGFFNRKVSSFRLERLQDVTVTITGVIATFLNFGTLKVQTAGATENNFTSLYLPKPKELQAVIQKAIDARMETINTSNLIQ